MPETNLVLHEHRGDEYVLEVPNRDFEGNGHPPVSVIGKVLGKLGRNYNGPVSEKSGVLRLRTGYLEGIFVSVDPKIHGNRRAAIMRTYTQTVFEYNRQDVD